MPPLVLYGSETGNSADLAELLVDRLRRLGLEPVVLPLGQASFELLQQADFAVILCSTTGQGALPANTRPFWQQLLKKSLQKPFASLRIATFGLGDSSYPRYNWAIRKIHNRLLQLGATELVDRGEADEQSPDGVEYTFQQWLVVLIAKLGMPSLPLGDLLPPRFSFSVGSKGFKTKNSHRDDLPVAEVAENRRLTAADHFQDVRHLSLKLAGATPYEPADVLVVYPANSTESVEAFIECQGWQDIADHHLEVDPKWEQQVGELVKPLTLRTLLTWHLDLNCVPRRSFFALASHFAQDRQQEKMAEFGSGEEDALQDLYNYANRPRRSLLEVVLEFETLKIPVEYLLDLMPILRSRQFSIASAQNENPLELTVAIVKYKTILHRVRRGLCTSWLQDLAVGDTLSYKIEKTGTKLLETAGRVRNVVCVATGTGIAPIRSFIKSYKGPARFHLYFGCRYHNKDKLYDDWPEHVRVKYAFSREGGSYVQQQIEQDAELKGVLAGALIFVCGSAGSMPVAVREAFVGIVGEQAIALKEKTGLYLQETY